MSRSWPDAPCLASGLLSWSPARGGPSPQAMAARAHAVARSGIPCAGVGAAAWVAGPDDMEVEPAHAAGPAPHEGPLGGGGGEPGDDAWAAGVGPDPAVGGGEGDYGTVLSAADVTALLADRDEAASPGVTLKAVLSAAQALWDASDQYAVCCRGTGRALILRSLRGDVCAFERDWVADGGPPVCPRGLVPQLLEVAARADAELLRALWAGPL
eukprot:XP_001690736.1 predicted protein [Chlamydomonas reinhardtii]